MSARTLVALIALSLVGCGDDGTNHLADAPPPPDAAPDSGPEMVPLLVTLAGSGAGTITSSPAGILCGAACESMFPKDLVVTLTAVPANGSVFAGWSGSCAGTEPTCEVTLANAKAATATFNLAMYTVTVTKAGAGTGTISGGGITCGQSCTVSVPHGTQLTLASTAQALSTFAGWGGACSGNAATCPLTITDDTTISANFTLDDVTLFVTKGGNGTGTVTSSPAGISCGADCDETYAANQMVTLAAVAGTGSTFTGWSGGGCSGNGTCTVTMTAAATVTATFTLDLVTLMITKSGDGTGTVNATGIACGIDCAETYDYGTTITLSAAPSTARVTLSSFTGWTGGGCTGTGACTITLTASTTIAAGFKLQPNLMFVTSTQTNGNLGGLAGADAICKDRAGAANLRGTYVAYLSSIDGNTLIDAPSRVGSASGWVRVDGRPVMNAISQMHLGTLANPPVLTEAGIDISQSAIVWTGTSRTGTFANACHQSIAPWAGPTGSAVIGLATATDFRVVNTDATVCDSARRLYCLGVDRAATVP